jgi:hypothetical protein
MLERPWHERRCSRRNGSRRRPRASAPSSCCRGVGLVAACAMDEKPFMTSGHAVRSSRSGPLGSPISLFQS